MNTWGAMYIIGTDGNLTTLADLKGKTLHSTGKGTTPDILLNFLLKQQGLDPATDLTVDATLPPVELAQLAAAGKVELALLPEPFVTLVLGKNADMKLLMDVSTLYREALAKPDMDIAQTCLVVRGGLLTERPDVVKAFMTAYEASLNTVNASPTEAGILAEKHQLIQSAALAEKAIPRSGIRYASAADAMPSIQTYLNVLLENAPEDIGGKLPDEDFYVLEY
jgi:NitT/TauT family transport system substrate-binding protein